MTKLEKLIQDHKLYCEETRFQLEEINKIDVSKFSAKEKEDIKTSVYELEFELSLRHSFLSELEDLL